MDEKRANACLEHWRKFVTCAQNNNKFVTYFQEVVIIYGRYF